ncbi:hypothetical protein [Sphingobacterium rhinopitheci]|uniref:hypothetical protein n=1 Tax=Sphingobacterium rhinopitheci TaxID=2781960 RepID=UPI001F51D3F1|nr:hypothetical protein [Sphingobacterium rhinopitheci]MCI0920165.1 hypothetical protein [Sphingobacterium rhinopitheci]
MKHILQSFILVVISLGFANSSFAQLSSQQAIGARFGSATGINYRYTLAQDRAVEGILSIQSNSISNRVRLVGLYEYFKPITNDFSWYYGFGGSIGSYTYKAFTDANGAYHNSNGELSLSIDGIVGIEYNVPNAPIALSLDIKPYFDFIQESSIRVFDPIGLSIRYKF